MLEIIIYRMLLYLKQATTTNSSYYKFIYSEIRRSNSVRRLQYFLFLYVFLPAVKSYFFSQRRQKENLSGFEFKRGIFDEEDEDDTLCSAQLSQGKL